MRAEVPKPGICSFFLLPITALNADWSLPV
jgi:hypothetical protein